VRQPSPEIRIEFTSDGHGRARAEKRHEQAVSGQKDGSPATGRAAISLDTLQRVLSEEPQQLRLHPLARESQLLVDDEDTDTTSTTYAQYLASGTGNAERVVFVPVNSGPPNYTNLGFAGFFLLNASYYSGLGGNDSACAEYIGTYVQGAAGQQVSGLAPGGSGAFHIKLYQ